MSTRIRLARGGKKKQPFYRIVVADSHSPRDGRFIERIGSYDPLLGENKCTFDLDRVNHWLSVGARPSERVSKLLALQGVEHNILDLPSEERVKAKADEAKAKADAKEAEAKAKAAEEAEAKKAAEAEAKKAAAEAKEAEAAAAAEAPAEAVDEAPAEAAPEAEKADA